MSRVLGLAVLAALGACGTKDAGGGAKEDASQPPATAADSAKQAIGGLGKALIAMAEKQESLDRANPYVGLRDPCVLLSRAEAEKYLGPLAADPYRASGPEPKERGSTCIYRGVNGQTVVIDPNNFNGGKMAMGMIKGAGGMVGQALVTESGSADTLEGDWDDVRWTFGELNALKGDVLVNVDVSGSLLGPVGAAALADIAIHHLDHPLQYDGAEAARKAPGPLVPPRDPCTLVTREEAAAILGPLSGDPVSGRDGCTYTVAGAPPRPVALQVTWTGGFKAMTQSKASSRMFQKSFTDPIEAGMDGNRKEAEMKKDTGAQKFIGQVQGVMRAMGGPAMEDSSLRLKTDTFGLKGPWDQAAILNGFTLEAVKKDVLVAVGLQYLDQKKAEALVAKAMSKI
jgi:hypothetical protein